MRLHHRKRDKPIRTYGKRQTTSAPDTTTTRGEPPAKRLKSTHGEPIPDTTRDDVAGRPSEPAASTGAEPSTAAERREPETSTAKPAKGSILNYFKRKPPPQTRIPLTVQSDPCPELSSPPSSPPRVASPRRRPPRLLRIRPVALPDIGTDGHEEEEEHEGVKNNDSAENKESKDAPRSRGRAKRLLLSNTDKNIDTPPQNTNDPPKQQPETRSRPKQAPTLQTILNLSSRPAFSECKICNTVWNPLYPDDIKYHSKRHAAVVRRERRKKEEIVFLAAEL